MSVKTIEKRRKRSRPLYLMLREGYKQVNSVLDIGFYGAPNLTLQGGPKISVTPLIIMGDFLTHSICLTRIFFQQGCRRVLALIDSTRADVLIEG
ncbi:hypothetical protein TNCV_4641491 [Trichonephila clavipes]|nr:hypothetical protein TNCV_4641491 [Trichonephila clavipes]